MCFILHHLNICSSRAVLFEWKHDMCLLIKSAFDGFSAVSDMQALAASSTSIECVSGNMSKNFMLNRNFFVCFLKQMINIILFQHTCAHTCETVTTRDCWDTTFTRHNYAKIAPQIPFIIWCVYFFNCILYSTDSIALRTLSFVWTRHSASFT